MQQEDFRIEDAVFERDGKSVRIVIPLDPVTKKNSSQILIRKTNKGKSIPFIYPSQRYKDYEYMCGLVLKRIEIDYPVNIKAEFYMKTRRHVDLTNLNEALHDVLVGCGTIADDNATVVVSTDGSRVYYDKENPRTEVLITPAEKTFNI